MANLRMPPKKCAIPLAVALVAALAVFSPGVLPVGLVENLFLAVFAGLIALAIWFDRRIKRWTPADKFSLLHPWKIPDPAARGAIWRIAAFDGALNAGQTAVLFALVGMTNLQLGLSGWLMAALVAAIMALTTLGGYWRYRRRYDPIAETGGRLLRYAGERPLSFREKCGVAAAVVSGVVACYAAFFLLLYFL